MYPRIHILVIHRYFVSGAVVENGRRVLTTKTTGLFGPHRNDRAPRCSPPTSPELYTNVGPGVLVLDVKIAVNGAFLNSKNAIRPHLGVVRRLVLVAAVLRARKLGPRGKRKAGSTAQEEVVDIYSFISSMNFAV